MATGDVLAHGELNAQAAADAEDSDDPSDEFDYDLLLAGIGPLVMKADLALCHLETPLAPDGGPYRGNPPFSAPPELAGALGRLGYDSCSTASDHALDQGEQGVKRTIDALDAAGVRHTGTALAPWDAANAVQLDIGGVKVAHVSFSSTFNATRPEDKPWLANELDVARVREVAAAARQAGAEVVIASLHWGEVYEHEPTDEQRKVAGELLDGDAVDLIIGHHPHVVQPIEQINGKWVAYSLGNSLARHQRAQGVTEEGVALRFRFARSDSRWRVEEATYVPTLVELGPPIRLIDLTISEPTPRRSKALKRTDEIVLSRGGSQRGLYRADG